MASSTTTPTARQRRHATAASTQPSRSTVLRRAEERDAPEDVVGEPGAAALDGPLDRLVPRQQQRAAADQRPSGQRDEQRRRAPPAAAGGRTKKPAGVSGGWQWRHAAGAATGGRGDLDRPWSTSVGMTSDRIAVGGSPRAGGGSPRARSGGLPDGLAAPRGLSRTSGRCDEAHARRGMRFGAVAELTASRAHSEQRGRRRHDEDGATLARDVTSPRSAVTSLTSTVLELLRSRAAMTVDCPRADRHCARRSPRSWSTSTTSWPAAPTSPAPRRPPSPGPGRPGSPVLPGFAVTTRGTRDLADGTADAAARRGPPRRVEGAVGHRPAARSSCARRRRSRTAARSRWPGCSRPCSTSAGWEAFLAAVDEVVQLGRRRPDRRARAAVPPAGVGRRAVRRRPGHRPHRSPRRRRRARRSRPPGQRAGRRRAADPVGARPARTRPATTCRRSCGAAAPAASSSKLARRAAADVRRPAGHRVGDRHERHARAAAEPPDHRRRRRGPRDRPGVRPRPGRRDVRAAAAAARGRPVGRPAARRPARGVADHRRHGRRASCGTPPSSSPSAAGSPPTSTCSASSPRRRSLWSRLDPVPPARRLKAAWRVGRLQVALPALADDLLDQRRRRPRLAAAARRRSADGRAACGCCAARARRCRRCTATRCSPGCCSTTTTTQPTAASAALRVLAQARRSAPLDDDELVAATPCCSASCRRSIGGDLSLPPPPASLPAAPAPAGGEAAVRESLRLRVALGPGAHGPRRARARPPARRPRRADERRRRRPPAPRRAGRARRVRWLAVASTCATASSRDRRCRRRSG